MWNKRPQFHWGVQGSSIKMNLISVQFRQQGEVTGLHTWRKGPLSQQECTAPGLKGKKLIVQATRGGHWPGHMKDRASITAGVQSKRPLIHGSKSTVWWKKGRRNQNWQLCSLGLCACCAHRGPHNATPVTTLSNFALDPVIHAGGQVFTIALGHTFTFYRQHRSLM